MKEKITMPSDFRAEGRCCVQYTDPVTGRVLEEIKGKNHVFSDQFIGVNYLLTPLQADLLLCAGGAAVDHDIPVVSGYPIGYGRVGEGTLGQFRGAYRAADSYWYRASRTKIDNKYVYDFLPNQAHGNLKYVGLTGGITHLNSGLRGAATASWSASIWGTVSQYNSTPYLFDCDTGCYYYLRGDDDNSNNTGSYFILTYRSPFDYAMEKQVDLLTLLGISGFKYGAALGYKLALDAVTKGVYVLVDYVPRGAETNDPVIKAFLLSADFTTVSAQWTLSNWSSGVNSLGGHNGGKLYFCEEDSTDNYLGYFLDVLDLTTGTFTRTRKTWDTEVAPACNCFRFNRYSSYAPPIYLFKNYMWPAPYTGDRQITSTYDESYFLYAAPMLDLSANGAMVCAYPPRPTDNAYNIYLPARAPVGLYSKQWGLYNLYQQNNNTSSRYVQPTLPFAYTCYQLPADAPARPEGSGMTVTYELDITW